MYTHGGTLPGHAPFTYYYYLFTSGRSWRKTPHILKRPSHIYLHYFSTKTSTGGLLPPFLKCELKHRLAQCLFLLHGVTLRLQYNTLPLIIQYNDTVRSYTQPILLLTIFLRTYTIVSLIFHNGWTLSPVIIRRASEVHLYNVVLR